MVRLRRLDSRTCFQDSAEDWEKTDGWMYDEFMTRRDAPTMIMNDLHRCDWCTPCHPSPFTDLLLLPTMYVPLFDDLHGCYPSCPVCILARTTPYPGYSVIVVVSLVLVPHPLLVLVSCFVFFARIVVDYMHTHPCSVLAHVPSHVPVAHAHVP